MKDIAMLEPHSGYFEHEKVSAIRYKETWLSTQGQTYMPQGLWTPVVDPENITYYSLFRPFTKNHYLSPRLPVDMGYWDTTSMMRDPIPNVLRLPIKFPKTNYRIPKELISLMPLIQRVADYESFINKDHDKVFAHITFDRSVVNTGQYHRFPGFHGDGYQGTKITPKITVEHSYIITTNPPTEFCLQPFFLNHLDESKHNMFLEFDKQAKEENIYCSLANHLYMIDPYMVHRTPEIENKTERLFVRITYTFSELEHPKNTINPMFRAYAYEDRIDIRNGLAPFEFAIPLHLYGLQSKKQG